MGAFESIKTYVYVYVQEYLKLYVRNLPEFKFFKSSRFI